MTTQSTFDFGDRPLAPWQGGPPRPADGEAAKRQGMDRAARAKADAVGYARELAFDIASRRADNCCHMGLVNEALAKEGKPGLGPAAGSVFLSSVWEFTGQRVKDTRAHAHANELKVWKLKGF